MFDSHIHTEISSDSEMRIKDAINKSKEIGYGIILTEHMDLNYPGGGKFRFDVQDYFEKYGQYRNDKLLLGIELGMHNDFAKENELVIINKQFDYILGSIHFLGKNDIYDAITYEGKSKRHVYENYFTEMKKNVLEHSYINCLGHIDYICRYSVYDNKYIHYNDFKEYVDEVLKAIISKDIVIEINTRRLDDAAAVRDLIPIYKRYFELGGRYAVLGSDAHNINAIACNFQKGREIAEHVGIKTIYFKDAKPQYNIVK